MSYLEQVKPATIYRRGHRSANLIEALEDSKLFVSAVESELIITHMIVEHKIDYDKEEYVYVTFYMAEPIP